MAKRMFNKRSGILSYTKFWNQKDIHQDDSPFNSVDNNNNSEEREEENGTKETGSESSCSGDGEGNHS